MTYGAIDIDLSCTSGIPIIELGMKSKPIQFPQ